MGDSRARARVKSEKLERREGILTAAAAMAEAQDLRAITMAAVAKQAGLAKGTLFLYFPTKESLFLEVASQALRGWQADCADWLWRTQERRAPAEVAGTFVAELERRPLLVRLLPQLHAGLAAQAPTPEAEAFTALVRAWAHTSGRALELALPFLPVGTGEAALLSFHALAVGHASLAESLGAPQFGSLRAAFEALLIGAALAPAA